MLMEVNVDHQHKINFNPATSPSVGLFVLIITVLTNLVRYVMKKKTNIQKLSITTNRIIVLVLIWLMWYFIGKSWNTNVRVVFGSIRHHLYPTVETTFEYMDGLEFVHRANDFLGLDNVFVIGKVILYFTELICANIPYIAFYIALVR